MIEGPTGTALTPGEQLGPYKIEGPLGAGGMGQVYKARDVRLDRSVAIKILRAQFSGRFEREARLISALNHRHICTLHDVGPNYLVMELVEGETLAARLKRGALPIQQVIQYGRQIADALAAAHSHGIIHRDLKPANIMITKSGVKVLDFGLAKSTQDDTLTLSRAVMGTPAYMAPEQRECKECDARTDIYALGLMLHEMAMGKRLPVAQADKPTMEGFPPMFAHVVKRCLEQDPENRWHAAADVKLELDWAAESQTVADSVRTQTSRRWVWVAGAVAGLGIMSLLGAVFWLRQNPIKQQPVEFTFEAPENAELLRQNLDTAPSPDGHRIAFVANDAIGTSAIWIRSLEAPEAQRIAGTDGATNPFWSPDGQFLGFFAQGKLRKIALAGGPPQNICSTTSGLGASWSPSGDIVFNPINRAPLMRVSAAGGTPQQLTSLDVARQENSHRWPNFLPDGRHFLFTARSGMKENTAIYVGSLDSKNIKRIVTEQSNASYVPPGYLLFGRDGTLMAQRFDAGRLELAGEAFPIAGGIDQETPSALAFFSVSADGNVLAYMEARHPVDQLTWFGRNGSTLGVVGPPGRYAQPRLSPDGKRLAVVIPDPENGNRDIWLIDLETASRTRFTSNPANDWWPAWSPDGAYIAFASDRTPRSSIYRKAVNGSGEEELLVAPPESGGAFRPVWSSDDRVLAYSVDKPKSGQGLWILPLFGARKPQPFLVTEFSETAVTFSPDSRWVAYMSTESGSPEIYVRPFDGPGKQRVSASGGDEPNWRRDGRELFYMAPGRTVMAAEIRLAESSKVAAPKPLFRTCTSAGTNPAFPEYSVTPDGERFLISCQSPGTTRRSITIAVGWRSMMKGPGREGTPP